MVKFSDDTLEKIDASYPKGLKCYYDYYRLC